MVLRLLERLDHAVAAVELELVALSARCRLRERLELTERGQVEPQAAGTFFIAGDLRLAAEAETLMPTSTSRTPAKNRSGWR